MDESRSNDTGGRAPSRSGWPWPWLAIAACLLVVLIGLLWPRAQESPPDPGRAWTVTADSNVASNGGFSYSSRARSGRRGSSSDMQIPPELVVSNKLNQFGRNRREVARALAKRANIEMPDSVERFFDAVDRGHWDEINS